MGKRLLDISLVLLTAPLWVPITLIAALLLAIDLRGNPIFLQTRIGKNGRPFTIYKLRTMRHAPPGQDHHHIHDFKTFIFNPPHKPNPRITRLGALMRRTSIDELPNLLNVLQGTMSLVGPRPEIPEIVAQYPPHYHRRHQVPPGITGLAQLNGRSDLTYDETITYDLAYVDNHTLRGDIEILLKTILAVLQRSGAR